ncbi:hypothetical protein EGW08_021672, partial [Elysia chlorotica]
MERPIQSRSQRQIEHQQQSRQQRHIENQALSLSQRQSENQRHIENQALSLSQRQSENQRHIENQALSLSQRQSENQRHGDNQVQSHGTNSRNKSAIELSVKGSRDFDHKSPHGDQKYRLNRLDSEHSLEGLRTFTPSSNSDVGADVRSVKNTASSTHQENRIEGYAARSRSKQSVVKPSESRGQSFSTILANSDMDTRPSESYTDLSKPTDPADHQWDPSWCDLEKEKKPRSYFYRKYLLGMPPNGRAGGSGLNRKSKKVPGKDSNYESVRRASEMRRVQSPSTFTSFSFQDLGERTQLENNIPLSKPRSKLFINVSQGKGLERRVSQALAKRSKLTKRVSFRNKMGLTDRQQGFNRCRVTRDRLYCKYFNIPVPEGYTADGEDEDFANNSSVENPDRPTRGRKLKRYRRKQPPTAPKMNLDGGAPILIDLEQPETTKEYFDQTEPRMIDQTPQERNELEREAPVEDRHKKEFYRKVDSESDFQEDEEPLPSERSFRTKFQIKPKASGNNSYDLQRVSSRTS